MRRFFIIAAYLVWVWQYLMPALWFVSIGGDWWSALLFMSGTTAYPLVYKRKE